MMRYSRPRSTIFFIKPKRKRKQLFFKNMRDFVLEGQCMADTITTENLTGTS